MPVKKATAKAKAKTATRKKPASKKKAKTGDPLQDTWNSAMDALQSAQEEAEKQIRAFLKKNKINAKDAAGVIDQLGERFDRERKKTVKEFERELSSFQSRIRKERKGINKSIDDAVKRGLAAFNIPSRQEVAELTRKVDQLSKKIDTFPAKPRKRAAAKKRTQAKAKSATPKTSDQ